MIRQRVVIVGLLGAVATVALTAPLWSAPVLRALPGFSVTQVEIRGTHLLAAHEAYEALDVDAASSVWDDFDSGLGRLRAHPAVEEVVLTRRLPRTLRLEVREKLPVALVHDGVLRAVSLDGVVLPVDLGRVPLDLPVIHPAALGRVVAERDGVLTDILVSLARLERAASARVSDVTTLTAAGDLRLHLDVAGVSVLMPRGADDAHVARLDAVLADRSAGQGPVEIDLRFRDQAIVRPDPTNGR